MLNHALYEFHIRKLNDLTVEMVQDFLQNYASGTLPNDTRPRTKHTVNACVTAIINFLVNYLKVNKDASIKESELYKEEIYKNHHNEIKTRKVPIFNVIVEKADHIILRDIPTKAFMILLNHIAEEHIELLGLVLLSAFAGLRPSEACNVRREDSPLGPGILIHTIDGEVTKIQIDLRRKILLRSDGKITGGIKKPRLQSVPAMFIEPFMEMYELYMDYLDNQPCEVEYGAFNLNRDGKAIMYRSYYNAFKNIVREELVPIYMASGDPELMEFGRILMEYDLAPHVLRHWYSVQLTLAGYDVPELMNARGDKSPESALTYLQDKGELEKQYSTVHNEAFDFMYWAAGEKHGV